MTPGLRALRTSVALSRLDHIVPIALRGPDAIEVLDRLSPKNLFIRDGEVLQTVFCNADGTVLADVLAIADDQDFVLLIEGMTAADAAAHLRAHTDDGEEVTVEDLGSSSVLLGLDGPYAWELLVAVIGPEVVGLPYLHAIAMGDGTILVRAGKTGEYGYVLICPPDVADGWVERLESAGAVLDLAWATLEDLDVCALENFFFTPRQAGLDGLTLPQLQLQWRVSPGKSDYLGDEALRAQMAGPTPRRLTYGTADEPVAPGIAVSFEGSEVGRVLGSARAGTVDVELVWMLLDRSAAHPHLDVVAGSVAIRTATPPLVNNRSLYVDPQKHTYATRHLHGFPALR